MASDPLLPGAPPTGWRRWLWPLVSRKVLTALATILAAYLAQAGLNVNQDLVYTILAVGASVIIGIAIEDHGKSGAAGAVKAADIGSPDASVRYSARPLTTLPSPPPAAPPAQDPYKG